MTDTRSKETDVKAKELRESKQYSGDTILIFMMCVWAAAYLVQTQLAPGEIFYSMGATGLISGAQCPPNA